MHAQLPMHPGTSEMPTWHPQQLPLRRITRCSSSNKSNNPLLSVDAHTQVPVPLHDRQAAHSPTVGCNEPFCSWHREQQLHTAPNRSWFMLLRSFRPSHSSWLMLLQSIKATSHPGLRCCAQPEPPLVPDLCCALLELLTSQLLVCCA